MTTMTSSSPWAEIDTPGKDYNVRKVPNTKGIPLFWGKDSAGHCLFIAELSGDLTEAFRRQHVNVQGIKTELRYVEKSGSQSLVVRLERLVDQDLFSALCQTMISVLREVSNSATALSVATEQLKRWKAFMAGKKRGILSPEEVRGLFGELIFLRQIVDVTDNERDAVKSWEGPESAQQDFIYSDLAIEIKTLSGRERNAVRISSEDQLDSLKDSLFLKVFRLTEMPTSDRALSLNDLVRKISSEFTDREVDEEFCDKLAKAGYVELHEYDSPKFIVSEERLYAVTEGFPRLIRSELPEGVANVRYSIALEQLKPFLAENETLWEA